MKETIFYLYEPTHLNKNVINTYNMLRSSEIVHAEVIHGNPL